VPSPTSSSCRIRLSFETTHTHEREKKQKIKRKIRKDEKQKDAKIEPQERGKAADPYFTMGETIRKRERKERLCVRV
jgi:hypothetical protein